jgi:hypothetical protein
MRCIWATSLKLSWGVFALRMVIQNMQEWVNREVRPELARWIEAARRRPPLQVFLSPGGSLVERSRRAASHEPDSERRTSTPNRSEQLHSRLIGARQSLQETSRLSRSSASGSMFGTSESSIRRTIEVSDDTDDDKDGDDDEDEEDEDGTDDEAYEEGDDSDDSDYVDEEDEEDDEEYEEYEEESEDFLDEGYDSPSKRKSASKVISIPSLRCRRNISCKCGKKNCWIVNDDDDGLAAGFNALSISKGRR